MSAYGKGSYADFENRARTNLTNSRMGMRAGKVTPDALKAEMERMGAPPSPWEQAGIPFPQKGGRMPQMQMGQGGVGPSGGFMNRLQQTFGGGRGPDPNYIAMSNMMNQTEGTGMFGGMGNMFGGRQKDPYQRYQQQMGQTQPEGPSAMEPQQDQVMGSMPMPQNPIQAPYGGGQDMGGGFNQAFNRMPQMPPPGPMGGMYGRMKQAMMNRPQQQPMQGGPFNRRPQQPPQAMGPQMRRPMGMGNRGIGPSMM